MSRREINILIADHERTSRTRLASELGEVGYSTETACTGSEAIIYCDSHFPDVLIVDTHLPDVDGFQVCARVRHGLRSNGNDPVVIFMADAPNEMTRYNLKQMVEYAGGDYFLVKLCDSSVILTLLEKLFVNSPVEIGFNSKHGPTYTTWPTARAASETVSLSV